MKYSIRKFVNPDLNANYDELIITDDITFDESIQLAKNELFKLKKQYPNDKCLVSLYVIYDNCEPLHLCNVFK